MPAHGHDNCPHGDCESSLVGNEPTCPTCSGPLFGIKPKTRLTQVEEKLVEVGHKVAEASQPALDKVEAVSNRVVEAAEPVFEKMTDATRSAVQTVAARFQAEENQAPNADDLVSQGEVLANAGQAQEALTIFNQAIATDPGNHMAWFNRGVVSESLGDNLDAVKCFKVTLTHTPDHGAAAANLAALLDRLGEKAEAAKYAEMALRAYPGHPTLSAILSAQGMAAPAPAITEEIVEIEHSAPEPEPEPVDPVLHAPSEADIWAAPPGMDVAPATPEPEPAPEPEPEPVIEAPIEVEAPASPALDLDALAESAAQTMRAGDAAGALEMLRDHLPAAAIEHGRCWRIAAGAMARLDLADNAKEAFSYALEIEPEDAAAWFNLGALHKRGEDMAEAANCFAKALELKPAYPKAANGLALSSLAIGDASSALDAFEKLIALEPAHPSGLAYAELLIDLGEGESAVLENMTHLPTTLPAAPEMGRKALTLIPQDASISHILLRARASSLTGDHAEAVTLYRSLLTSDKDNGELWLGLARALESAGDLATATKCHEKARSLGIVTEMLAEEEPAPVEDLWATPEPVVETVVESVPTTEEILVHEAALDLATPEPEPVVQTPNIEVDLAAAALEASATFEASEPTVSADSASVANQAVLWYNQGQELILKEQYREALSCFDRALPEFKDDPPMAIKILNGRGNCHYYMNEFKKAIENYYKAFQIDGHLTTGRALYNMGTAYAELESYDNAISCFQESIGKTVGEPLSGENKKRAKEQIRRCKHLLKEQKKRMR